MLVELSNEELMHLDGKVNPKVQIMIDRIKVAFQYRELGHPLDELIADSMRTGELMWIYQSLRGSESCDRCKTSPGYVDYLSGRNRGKVNWNRPISIDGFTFRTCDAAPDIRLCRACALEAIKILKEYILGHDLQIQIPEDTRYARENERLCYKCGAKIWEFDMIYFPSLMGKGFYYAACPLCRAEVRPFNACEISFTGVFRMVPVCELRKIDNLWTRRKG